MMWIVTLLIFGGLVISLLLAKRFRQFRVNILIASFALILFAAVIVEVNDNGFNYVATSASSSSATDDSEDSSDDTDDEADWNDEDDSTDDSSSADDTDAVAVADTDDDTDTEEAATSESTESVEADDDTLAASSSSSVASSSYRSSSSSYSHTRETTHNPARAGSNSGSRHYAYKPVPHTGQSQTVYVNARIPGRYHKDPNCRGLQRYGGGTAMTLAQAQQQGYVAFCAYERYGN